MEKDQAIGVMLNLLKLVIERDGSDLFITVGSPPAIKIHGKITLMSEDKLRPEHTKALVYSIMNDKQLKEFESTKECNFAVTPVNIGRFRANAYIQQGFCGMVMHSIETELPGLKELKLPDIFKDIVMTKHGLVIMVGGSGSGKSTSLAAMIDYRNQNSFGHIITLEDPIEYVHPHKNCIVTQREVGVDTDNWGIALKNSFRQAPDVILLGEIRDKETMGFGIAFAETGHLAMLTMHANSGNHALDRIINFFPEGRRNQLLMDLGASLKAVVAQRLIKKIDGESRVAAIEILLNSPLIADLISKGQIHDIKAVMAKSEALGMRTFDQALFDLYASEQITMEDALRNADSVNELRLRFKLECKKTVAQDNLDHLSLEKSEAPPSMMR